MNVYLNLGKNQNVVVDFKEMSVIANGLRYIILNDNEASVGDYNLGRTNALVNLSTRGDLTISNIVNVNSNIYRVTEIGRFAFQGCKISRFIIQEGIRYIDDRAFNECSELIEIFIPSTIHTLGPFCINRNPKLEMIYIMPFSQLYNTSYGCFGDNSVLKEVYFCSRNYYNTASIFAGSNSTMLLFVPSSFIYEKISGRNVNRINNQFCNFPAYQNKDITCRTGTTCLYFTMSIFLNQVCI